MIPKYKALELAFKLDDHFSRNAGTFHLIGPFKNSYRLTISMVDPNLGQIWDCLRAMQVPADSKVTQVTEESYSRWTYETDDGMIEFHAMKGEICPTV